MAISRSARPGYSRDDQRPAAEPTQPNEGDTLSTQNPYFLSHGSHTTGDEGRCAMEWVSYLAGEKHSDSPACVSAVLTRYCIRLNDRLDDVNRQRLRPYLARTIGTRGDGMDGERLRLCTEYLLHDSLPHWAALAGREDIAQMLRAMPDTTSSLELRNVLRLVRDEMWEERRRATDRLAEKIRAELVKRGWPAAAAAAAAATAAATAAAAAAAAADAAAAAAAAATATADVAAAATAAATATADVAVAAAATATAAADATATADAAATAAADAAADYPYSSRNAVYNAVYAKVSEMFKARRDERIDSAFDLLDRMLLHGV